MKKWLLAGLLLCLPSTAFASGFYFDCSVSPANYTTCSIGTPCTDLPGTSLNAASARSAGDTFNFKRGNACSYDGTAANILINSAGAAGNFIYMQSYGTGSLPKFTGGPISGASWTNPGGARYRATGQSLAATRAISTADDDKGLMRWDGNNTNLVAGSYCWTTSTTEPSSCTTSASATVLYVRTYDDGSPASHGGIRISNISLTAFTPLVGGVNNSSRGKYVRFRDIVISTSPDRGFTTYYNNNEIVNVQVLASVRDGIDLDDNCTDCWLYYPYAGYNATNGGGTGQNITIQGFGAGTIGQGFENAGWDSEYGGQAGLDVLDYGANNASQNCILDMKIRENGISPNSGSSSDPDLYFDGASEWFANGNIIKDAGKGLASRSGAGRYGVQFGSEHPTTDPCQNGQFINNLVYASSTRAFYMLNSPQGTGTLPNSITMAYNTMVANEAGATDQVQFPRDVSSTANNIVVRDNIFVGNSTAYINWIVTTGGWISGLDADYNLYYIRGQASASTNLFDTNGGSGTHYNLDGSGGGNSWRTLSGEDAAAAYGNPAFVSEASEDFHLGGASPGLAMGMASPYAIYSWVPQTIKDDLGALGIKGSTVAAGTEDTTGTNVGFHYHYRTPTSITAVPTSLVAGSSGNFIVQFTIPQNIGGILYNGKVRVTLPAGWSWSSGGTTAVSSSAMSGTFGFAASSQLGTFTRVGDGNSEFYGTYNIVATHVGVSSTPGLSGTFLLEIMNSAGAVIMKGTAPAQTVVASPGGPHFSTIGF